MKLRNKKTGEIVEDTDILAVLASAKYDIPLYRSLAELNKEWEDYRLSEPLIKDNDIRKAVRVWAEVNEIDKVMYDRGDDSIYYVYGSSKIKSVSISFNRCNVFEGLKHRRLYTITQLCG